MKNILFLILLFVFSGNVIAQNSKKIDSIFYLLDTLKTSVNDRMWDIGIDGQFKYYTIECACLEHGLKPTFLYRLDDMGKVYDSKQIGVLKQSSLINLINSAKKLATVKDKGTSFFIIEPAKNKYVVHKVFLIEPRKPDVVN